MAQGVAAVLAARPNIALVSRSAASIAFMAISMLVLLAQRRLIMYYRVRLRNFGHDPDAMDNINTSTFLKQLRTVAAIVIPGWRSKEVAATATFVGLFGLKACLNIVRVNADSTVVQAVISRNSSRTSAMLWFGAVSAILATVTGTIEQLRFSLIAHYRARLTRYFHDRLFHAIIFYRVGLADDRLSPGTAITTYCHEFAEHFAELPYYFVLPFAEATASLFFLAKQAGVGAAAMVVAGTVASLFFLRSTSPEFGRMHAVTLESEERFRVSHSDVKNHSEQLALQNGGDYMRRKLNHMFFRVYDALGQVAAAKGYFSLLQNVVSLGVWDLMPLLLAAHKSNSGISRNVLLQALLVQRPLIRKFHQSVEALIENIKEASHLYEFTDKLAEFDRLLRESLETLPEAVRDDLRQLPGVRTATDDADTEIDSADAPPQAALSEPSECGGAASQIMLDLDEDADGNALEDQSLVLREVTVETPGGGAVLIKNLSFTVHRGQHFCILGPNGTGKTSILRVMAGLWQPAAGSVSVSRNVELFFLPQAAFLLSNATLFEQLAFPEALEHNGQRAIATRRDQQFAKLAMASAFAESIVQLLGGWESPVCGLVGPEEDTSYPWDSLSGGQQQKVAMARLFFRAQVLHSQGKCCFAMLDESTSQIDADSEDIIFDKLKDFGVTYVSVTHRERVIRHHTHAVILQPQRKGYKIRPVRADMPAKTESGHQMLDY